MTVQADLARFIGISAWRAGLSSDQIERVDRDAFSRSYKAGATVCARGSPSLHWLGVIDGMLKVDTVSGDGKSTTFAGVPAGAWFGEGAVLKGEARPYAVVAIRDSTVAFLPRATFLWLIDESRSVDTVLVMVGLVFVLALACSLLALGASFRRPARMQRTTRLAVALES